MRIFDPQRCFHFSTRLQIEKFFAAVFANLQHEAPHHFLALEQRESDGGIPSVNVRAATSRTIRNGHSLSLDPDQDRIHRYSFPIFCATWE